MSDKLLPSTCIKRDGRRVPFDRTKIENAIYKAFLATGWYDNASEEGLEALRRLVTYHTTQALFRFEGTNEARVEEIQDEVVAELRRKNSEVADKYDGYRTLHKILRGNVREITPEIQASFAESATHFKTALAQFVFFDKYSRYDYTLMRRETYNETTDRVVTWLRELTGNKFDDSVYERIRWGMLTQSVMPSMRAVAMAGEAANRQNVCIYNCSYLPISSILDLREALTLALNGVGVGFSVERKYVEQFPVVAFQKDAPKYYILVEDSSEGWANAYETALEKWWAGEDVDVDVSLVRPANAVLRVKGGRASGPGPLVKLLESSRAIILGAQGRQITTVEAHDLACLVGEAVVQGGVRRTALLSMFNHDDEDMLHAKDNLYSVDENGTWSVDPAKQQRQMANNSTVWPDRQMTREEISKQFHVMHNGGAGEPGIANQRSFNLTIPERRKRFGPQPYGINPCGEVILRPYGLCNLSIAVARADDTFETLAEKVELAAIIGTAQSAATFFPGLRDIWRKNAEEERLLGVDITGQFDSEVVRNPEVLARLKQIVVETNKKYAAILGIQESAATTVCKPSGNSSQLLSCASGIHPRFAKYYIRNVRVKANTPVYHVLKANGVPLAPDRQLGQEKLPEHARTMYVASFPVASPEGAITRRDLTALDQCRMWLMNKVNWTEHNPSISVYYRPNELEDIIDFVFENQDLVGGMSFFPAAEDQGTESVYPQLPYEEIDQETYEKAAAALPEIDWSILYSFEIRDETEAAQTIACSTATGCEF